MLNIVAYFAWEFALWMEDALRSITSRYWSNFKTKLLRLFRMKRVELKNELGGIFGRVGNRWQSPAVFEIFAENFLPSEDTLHLTAVQTKSASMFYQVLLNLSSHLQLIDGWMDKFSETLNEKRGKRNLNFPSLRAFQFARKGIFFSKNFIKFSPNTFVF